MIVYRHGSKFAAFVAKYYNGICIPSGMDGMVLPLEEITPAAFSLAFKDSIVTEDSSGGTYTISIGVDAISFYLDTVLHNHRYVPKVVSTTIQGTIDEGFSYDVDSPFAELVSSACNWELDRSKESNISPIGTSSLIRALATVGYQLVSIAHTSEPKQSRTFRFAKNVGGKVGNGSELVVRASDYFEYGDVCVLTSACFDVPDKPLVFGSDCLIRQLIDPMFGSCYGKTSSGSYTLGISLGDLLYCYEAILQFSHTHRTDEGTLVGRYVMAGDLAIDVATRDIGGKIALACDYVS